ncbi:hypothetical protein D9758_004759 [Tetrapyrgos nigripes]|uniref:AAA+ ATPase domain-containing protein n=1 Tax=Tetrapyrgos nigripes TaxID=182062 RepID=A0A8H5G5Y9_9AGAR|nr:hypothetical protein D9758_004759 [Tetrapyrgos nigripes]
MTPPSSELEDAFVNVWVDGESTSQNKDLYSSFVHLSSAQHSHPGITTAHAVKKFFPSYSLVSSTDYGLNILGFPEAQSTPLKDHPLITSTYFVNLARASAPVPGMLVDRVQVGAFNTSWQGYDFIMFVLEYPKGIGMVSLHHILHDGPEEPARQLCLRAGLFANALHDEIWVFNQGFWNKDAGLWQEIQKADWKDVILKDEFKKSLKKDVYGFFESEKLYKELGIPWKRGLILYGPPGNGKTISLKTIMKTCDAMGYAPLYVKSFQSWQGEEASMQMVFGKARQLAPCLIILEDLDSLINDGNRSFFLNQLDGLDGNDGLLVIGTTNHFDRLDPGISSRPSRFDRKYLFDDPDRDERVLYVKYWQNKLKDNKSVTFPDSMVDEVADATDKFSFAYLKEAFVSALVTMAGYEDDDHPSFKATLMDQIKQLRKQLDKPDNYRAPLHARRPLPVITKGCHQQLARPVQTTTSVWSGGATTSQNPTDVRFFTGNPASDLHSINDGLASSMGGLQLHHSIRAAYPQTQDPFRNFSSMSMRRSVPGEFLPTWSGDNIN